jgi:divalent metal cation (Fe/Co/Zn/Cd) transporter
MAEQDEAIQEIHSRNKHQALQQKRMQTIIQVAGLLGIEELKYINNEISDMIADVERKINGK